MVTEEHQVATGTKEAVRLADPGRRFTPDRRTVLADREVERTVWLGNILGVAVHPFDAVESMGIAQASRRHQLGLGVVDGVHRRAATPHPRRHVAGPTAEFDGPLPG